MGKATGRKETTWTTLVATPTRRASEETGGVTRWPQPASLAGASGWYGRSSLSRYRCDRSKPIDPWVTFEPPVALPGKPGLRSHRHPDQAGAKASHCRAAAWPEGPESGQAALVRTAGRGQGDRVG